MTMVLIRDELEHIRNYLRIQELRFPNRFTYKINVPELLLDTFMPPLMIQTFVENTIKYGVSMETPIELLIDISLVNEVKDSYIKINIEDTGKGFTEEMLMELNAGKMVIDDKGTHIGVWNVKRRLELLYLGNASVRFYNKNPQGAVVEINLPKPKDV
jgi:two-component system sensor histidine kinase YesM